ncbi:MAG: beta-propeller domain-containing protein [Acidimicrobiia bacterium]|nr:beta-propeller domain-containing protein [Acidimicrobiia bacterium]
MKTRFTVVTLALLLVASACSSDDAAQPSDPDPTTPTTVDIDGDGSPDVDPRPRNVSFRSTLRQINDCDELLAHLRAEGAARVGPYGLLGGWYGGPVPLEGDVFFTDEAEGADFDGARLPAPFEEVGGAADDAGEAPAASTVSPEFSGTNVQELGIDEPDLVKTDGERIITLTDNVVHIVDVTAATARIAGTVRLDDEAWGQDMLLVDDTLFVIRQGGDFGIYYADAAGIAAEIAPGRYAPTIVIDQIDISDWSAPEIEATLTTSGTFVSGRLHDGTVRLVLRSDPDQLEFVQPQSQAGEDKATEVNREVINESTLEDWLPSYVLETGDTTGTGLLVACDQVHRPTEFAGFGTTTVLTIDPAAGLEGGDAAGVLAPAETVYGSNEALYVAAPSWVDPTLWERDPDLAEELAQKYATSIHRFALTDAGVAYDGSGAVDGRLLNQFSLSEHDGHLRVATTVGDPWGWGDQGESQSKVHALRIDDDGLTEVGVVGNLGRGEEIRSVRFVGDQAYVVTFRQTDPFYVVDLRDPTDPQVTGELKILGYSGYLHPLSDDLVLGVGQDGTEDGALTGAKVTVFDVSDPAKPIDLHNWVLDGASTDIEWDHRAFLWWAPERIAVLPLNDWSSNFSGAVVLEIGDDGTISERGRIQHRPDGDDDGRTDCDVVPAADVEGTQGEDIVSAGGVILHCGPDEGGISGYECYTRLSYDELLEGGFVEGAEDLAGLAEDEFIEVCEPIRHDEQIVRTLVIDDSLWSLSNNWLQAQTIDTLDRTDRVDL